MARKSWHLSRRAFLYGTGVSLGLPLLESMSLAEDAKELPRRFCSVYFPYGVNMVRKEHKYADWTFFPDQPGRDFKFTKTLEPLSELREYVSVLGGLSHPHGRKMGGHDTADIFLTGAKFQGTNYRNSVSIDQCAAMKLGRETRLPSLTLSSDGGVGEPTRTTTLSYSPSGRPVPALAKPRQVFARLFGNKGDDAEYQTELENSRSLLDLVLEHASSMRRNMGTQDQRKLDEYLDSVRTVEKRVESSQRWLNVPVPQVDPDSVDLDAQPDSKKEGVEDYLDAMYDLMFLAFQTDTTRLATYMIAQKESTSIGERFPTVIGLSGSWHGLGHGGQNEKNNGGENLGRFIQYLVGRHARFLQKMKDTPEGDGTLLDRTMVLFGCSNSVTHQNRNYPLIFAGGNGLGIRNGHYLKFDEEKTPLANLFVTVLNQLDVPTLSFADSTGPMAEKLI